MATTLVTKKIKSSSVLNFLNSNATNYLFISDHLPESNTIDLIDTVDIGELQLHNSIIAGKKIQSADILPVVNKNSYESNKVYDMYEHDVPLEGKKFFVSVDEGSYIHFYKCLDNNNNGLSTSQPTFSHISGANTSFYRTGDGYLWKYLYTITNADKLKFSTTNYLPVVANSTVKQTAQSRVIDVIKIETVGRKYDNYLSSSFGASDIAASGNLSIYKIDDSAKNSNSFYTDCLIYLSSGTGAGQYKTISDYFSNNSGKYIVLEEPFYIKPTNGTTYEITPKIQVIGTGNETSNVVARALVNSTSSNSIYRVEILDKGSGYSHQATATVLANSVVGVLANASLKVILPPTGGHGFDILNELYVNKFEISVKLSNSESSTISTDNGFKQVGIIKNPLFNDVVVSLSNSNGLFFPGENIFSVSPQKILSNLTTNNQLNSISVSLDSYNNNIVPGSEVILLSNTSTQLNSVTFVNSSIIQLSSNVGFNSTNCTCYFANKIGSAVCKSINGVSSILLSNAEPKFSSNSTIIGEHSGAFAKITTITRGGVQKDFNTFVNLTKFEGSLTTGIFDQNEQVLFQPSSNATGYMHNTKTTNVFSYYISNINGNINNSTTVIGVDSQAIATIDQKYSPEIEFNSGEILYIENINRILRTANTSETFQFIFEY